MKMDRVEASFEVPVPKDVERQLDAPAQPDPRGGFGAVLTGILFLALALPYWTVRIVSQLIWRDLRRVGRLAGLCGSTYLEALRRS
jgi:hypothetical protein